MYEEEQHIVLMKMQNQNFTHPKLFVVNSGMSITNF